MASTAAPSNPLLRDPPVIIPHAHLKPPQPGQLQRVTIRHPVLNMIFLALPAYDYDSSNAVWGVHYGTVSTACWVLAGNHSGYFTSTGDDVRIEKADDDILPAGNYRYFLDDGDTLANYPICIEFENWLFPETIPPAWDTSPVERLGGTITSDAVRRRDNRCLMSGKDHSLTMAHLVPVAQAPWLNRNSANLHLDGPPFDTDPANLISLASDVHVPQFDEGVWVPVPKFGQYLTHFLREAPTLAAQYHNVLFKGTAVVSGRLLLARFAWSTFKNAQKARLSGFQLLGPQTVVKKKARRGGDKKPDVGDVKGKKRMRSSDGGDEDEYMPSGSGKPITATPKNQDNEITLSDESLRDPSDLSLVELYAEQAQLEKRKEEYFKANPQIRQHSDKVLPSDYCSEAMDSD